MLCLNEDFKYFCDINYLKLIPARYSTGAIIKGDMLLYNTRYNFIFNHESPDHCDLYLTQKWGGGKNHYVDNNFSLFIERYERRINNFRNYVNNINNNITFVIGKYNPCTKELSEIITPFYI